MIDVKAIQKRLQELEEGNKSNSTIQFWKPNTGSHVIRALPWPDSTPDMPLKELWFYYFGKKGILSPSQFNHPDPVKEKINLLYSTKDQNDIKLAQKLKAKQRFFLPVVIRSSTSEFDPKKVYVWSFGKIVYMRLLGFFVNKHIENFLCPHTGRDLNVKGVHLPNKEFPDTTVDPEFSASPLSANEKEAQEYLKNIPDLGQLYKELSYDEVNNVLNTWLNGGTVVSNKDGAVRNQNNDTMNALKSLEEIDKSNRKSAYPDLDKAFAGLGTDDLPF